MKYWIYCAFLIGMFTSLGYSQNTSINIDGNWSLTIDASDLTGGPGSNLQSIYNSSNDATVIDLDLLKSPGNWYYWILRWDWRVDVNMQTLNWVDNWEVWLRRTGDGDYLLGSIEGGETFQQLSSMNILFCSGNRNHNNIPLEYELRGVTLPLEAGQYSAIVYFTLTEL